MGETRAGTIHSQQGERPTARGLIFDARRMLAAGGYKKGCVLCDAPAHNTIEELLEMRWNEHIDEHSPLEDWNEHIDELTNKGK